MGSFSLYHWIIMIGIGYWIYRVFKKPAGKSEPAQTMQKTTAEAPSFHWPEEGDFEFEVVGESNYQAAIRKIAGPHGDNGPDVQCTALLIPENGNQYDDKAVRVDINSMTVGYLAKDDARRFRRRLAAKKLSGRTTSCAATLTGGHILADGSRAHYGVQLDMKPFEG